ncbi:MAG: hypothetical protein KKH68_10315 [Proteobacteria bacterium]|nr:hypothetical protein [Pseudomonadota bacterium]
MLNIIQTRLGKENDIYITEPIDVALAFWMVHEAQEKKQFLQQIRSFLKNSGLLLIVEPKLHVSHSQFNREINIAQSVGFRIKDEPKIAFSHAVLLEKAEYKTFTLNERKRNRI